MKVAVPHKHLIQMLEQILVVHQVHISLVVAVATKNKVVKVEEQDLVLKVLGQDKLEVFFKVEMEQVMVYQVPIVEQVEAVVAYTVVEVQVINVVVLLEVLVVVHHIMDTHKLQVVLLRVVMV